SLYVKEELYARAPRRGSFANIDVLIVYVCLREARPPPAKGLFDAGREKQLRIDARAIGFRSRRHGQQHHGTIWRSNPSLGPVVYRDAVAVLCVDDAGHLRRHLKEELERHLLMVGLITLVRSANGEA